MHAFAVDVGRVTNDGSGRRVTGVRRRRRPRSPARHLSSRRVPLRFPTVRRGPTGPPTQVGARTHERHDHHDHDPPPPPTLGRPPTRPPRLGARREHGPGRAALGLRSPLGLGGDPLRARPAELPVHVERDLRLRADHRPVHDAAGRAPRHHRAERREDRRDQPGRHPCPGRPGDRRPVRRHVRLDVGRPRHPARRDLPHRPRRRRTAEDLRTAREGRRAGRLLLVVEPRQGALRLRPPVHPVPRATHLPRQAGWRRLGLDLGRVPERPHLAGLLAGHLARHDAARARPPDPGPHLRGRRQPRRHGRALSARRHEWSHDGPGDRRAPLGRPRVPRAVRRGGRRAARRPRDRMRHLLGRLHRRRHPTSRTRRRWPSTRTA